MAYSDARRGSHRADERRRGKTSPMTSVAARGPGRQRRRCAAESPGVRARRRKRATISDRRGGLAAALLSQRRWVATGRRRRQRGRATRRAGDQTRRSSSSGDARRVVADEYQCLCSEQSVECCHRQSLRRQRYVQVQKHHSILSRFFLFMTSGGSMQNLAAWGREGKPSPN